MKHLISLILPFLMFSSASDNTTNIDKTCGYRPLRVAVIDTGLDLSDKRFEGKLCNKGHQYFTGDTIKDTHRHGTHVAGLITKYAGDSNYCLLIYKFHGDRFDGSATMDRLISSLYAAMAQGADVVNISGGGRNPSYLEKEIIKNNPNVIFVVAAGNNGENLDLPENTYFPASYFLPNIIAVSSLDRDGKRSKTSNWSKKTISELGEEVVSFLPNGGEGPISGTSQATAIATGKLVNKIGHICGK